MKTGMNLVFLGGFEYPDGMAETKRIQHAINGLKVFPDIKISVVVLRQSSENNVLNGDHQGISYQTVMGDLLRLKMILMAPLFYAKSRSALRRLFHPDRHNMLYVYGPPSFDNLPAILHARKLGYKIVFDIVEDFDLARNISKSLWHSITMGLVCRMTGRISSLADGVVVISSHLAKKYHDLTRGAMPIHHLTISVDVDRYPEAARRFSEPITLFYAGSFGMKDGLPVLLDAFDTIAGQHSNVQLIMTGRGADEVMDMLRNRIALSPHSDRIFHLGFLDDKAYYAALNAADILCMPRIDMGYAQAGFPFKLGEYLSTGKPVIASAVSDVPDLLEDQRDVLLVPPGKSESIVEAVDFLIANPDRAFSIGSSGRAAALKLFDYREQGRDLNSFLRGITSMEISSPMAQSSTKCAMGIAR